MFKPLMLKEHYIKMTMLSNLFPLVIFYHTVDRVYFAYVEVHAVAFDMEAVTDYLPPLHQPDLLGPLASLLFMHGLVEQCATGAYLDF